MGVSGEGGAGVDGGGATEWISVCARAWRGEEVAGIDCLYKKRKNPRLDS